MESTSLKTASTYINNLLLARGLLRDGEPIAFEQARTYRGRDEDATMAKIMSLVHDLILRRDREQSHHSTLTAHLQNLRAESSQNSVRFSRLQSSNDTLTRQLVLAETTARNAQAALKAAEHGSRRLEQELAKAKQKACEVRRAADKDIRKRDEMLKGLKGHLSARQRGSKVGLVGASVTITPGSTGSHSSQNGNVNGSTADVADPAYSLKQETTEFLTQLSQSLSDENDGLIALLRGAVHEVEGLLDVPAETHKKANGNQRQAHVRVAIEDTAMVNALPASYEALAADMERVLSQLREVLTSPNFVPLEEVEIRDEEIGMLRHGWERMEARWREAVAMMEGWKKRMEEKGDTVQLEDLKKGLGLGQGLEALVKIAGSARKRDDSSGKTEEDHSRQASGEWNILKEQTSMELNEDEAPASSTGSDMFKLEFLRQAPLRETQGRTRSPRRVSFVPNLDGWRDEKSSELDILARAPDLSPRKVFGQEVKGGSADTSSKVQSKSQKRRSSPPPPERASKVLFSSDLSEEEQEDEDEADDGCENEGLTVHDKLRAAQIEAEVATEARARKTEKQESKAAGGEASTGGINGVGSPAKAVRKTRIGGRPKRRKSTLTPDELMGLLGD
ncbi:MAG: hypothetical protein M1821_001501 [Bathelium mastoideum]|nr:MAG: hypothetical protein M1821_001501 [Bathelium mastoideum]